MKQNLSVDNLLKPYIDSGHYTPKQLIEIESGLKNDLDISVYANPAFNEWQMLLIKHGLIEGHDVSTYANPAFDGNQMRQILTGLRHNLDISSYADPNIPWKNMKTTRQQLKRQKK